MKFFRYILVWLLFVIVSSQSFSQTTISIAVQVGSNDTICNNGNTQLVATVIGCASPAYQWYRNGITITSGGTGSTISLNAPGGVASGDIITCRQTNITAPCSLDTSNGIRIVYKENQAITWINTSGNINQTSCQFTAITPIRFQFTGATNASVSSLPNGVTGSYSNGVYTISGTPTVNGTFNYQIQTTGSGLCGSTAQTGGTLTVKKDAVPTLTNAGQTQFIVFNGVNYFIRCVPTTNANISLSNTTINISAISSYKIKWGDLTPDTTFNTFSTNIFHNYQSGFYQLTLTTTSTDLCTSSVNYGIFVGNSPQGNLGNPGTLSGCGPLVKTFPISGTNINVPGTTYFIEFGDGSDTIFTHPNIPPSITHSYSKSSCGFNMASTNPNSFTATMTIANPCFPNATPTVGPIVVSTSPKPNIAIDKNKLCVNETVIIKDSSDKGNYIDATGCKSRSSTYWTITPATGWNTASNLGNNGGQPNDIDFWTNGDNTLNILFTQSGNYTISLFNANNCNPTSPGKRDTTICVNPTPTASFTTPKDTLCARDNLSITSTSNIPLCGSNTYKWTVTPTDITGCNSTLAPTFINGTSDTSANPQMNFSKAGSYKVELVVMIKGTSCTSTIFSKTITVKGKPNISINAPSSICQNTKIYPTATTTCNVAAAIYSWSFQSGNPATSTLLIPDSILMTGTGSNTISLSATNECGVTNTSTSITINAAPTLTANPIATSICSGQPITINLSSNLTGIKYNWTSTITTGTATGNSNQAIPTSSASINNTLSNTGSIDAIIRYTITVVGATPTSCVGETKTVDITVKAGVSAADAGASQILCNQTQITLAAINPTVGTGVWTKLSGLVGETITNTSQNNTTVTGLVVGDYIFKWTINGSGGSCPNSSDTVTINNRPNNTQANVGIDIIKCNYTSTNNTVTLTGNIASSTRNYETATWSIATQPAGGNGVINNPNNPSSTFTFNAAGNYVLVYTISNDANCPATKDTILVKAYNPPNAGTTSGAATVCKGNNSGTITATGNVEPIFKWQYAIGLSNIWIDTTVTTASINYTNLDTTKQYRIVVKSLGFVDGCASTDFSSITTITVNSTSVGGIANGSASVCSNSNNGNITLTGNGGTITGWEFSTDNGTTWLTVTPSNTTSTLSFDNLTTTTQYRSIVKNGVCPQTNSSVATITVNAGVGAANAGSDSILCSATSTTLNGNALATGTTGAWTQIGTPLATITNATQNNTTATNLVAANDYNFRWTVSGVAPCASTQDDVVIKVRPTVTTANAGVDILKCDYSAVNNTQQLNGNTNPSRIYETGIWSFVGSANGATISNSNASNAIITFANAGNYQLTWTISNDAQTTDLSCKKSIDTINITVKEFPIAGTINGTTTICKGTNAGTLILTGHTATANIQWQSSLNNITYTDIATANTTSYNVGTISVSTWFRVKVNQTNCSDTVYAAPFEVQVDELSVGGNITPILSEVCTNSANLTLVLNAQTATTINWVYNIDNGGYNSFSPALTTTNISVATNPYLINTTAAIKTIVVKAVVKNGVCPADSSVSSTIKVYPNTEQANAGADQFLCKKDSINLAATSLISAAGNWLQLSGPNNAIINSITNPTTLISNLVVGNYKFEWSVSGSTTNICPATKDTVEIFNDDTLTNSIKTNQDTLCTNQALNLSSLQTVSGGNGIYTYQWQQSIDGINWINVSANDTLENLSAIASTTLYFRRNINSSNCNKYSNVVKVIVQPGISNNSIAANQNVCINIQPNLLVGQIPTGGNGVYAYQWQQNNNGIWTNIFGANGINYQPPIYTTILDTSFRRVVSSGFCIGDLSNEIKITVNPDAKAVYTYTNDKLCTPAFIDTSNIKAQDFTVANSSYEWYANGILIGTGLQFPGYTILNNGDTVYIKLKAISAFGCKADSFEHKFYTVKTPTVSFTKSIAKDCGPLTVSFTNNTTPLNTPTYSWDFGNGQTSTAVTPPFIVFMDDTSNRRNDTTYYIKLTAITQCDTIKFTDSVTVFPKPKALFQPDTTVGCSVFQFRAFNNSLGTYNTYTWDFGDSTAIIIDTLGGYIYHNFFTAKTDTFTVKLKAKNKCGSDSFEVKVVVFPNTIVPKIIVDGNLNFGCAPIQIRFVNNTIGASKFTMNFGDGSLPYLTNKNPDTVYHTYSAGGNFVVTLKAENSCTDSTVSLTLKLFNKPQALFSLSPNQFCKNELVHFTNGSDSTLSFEWRFGDGGTSTNLHPKYAYKTAGNYEVTLIAKSTNATGSVCTDTIKSNIIIHDLPTSSFTNNAAIQNCQPYYFVGIANLLPDEIGNWRFFDAFSNDTTQAGNVGVHSFKQTGFYNIRLVVFNVQGCSDTSSTTVKVIETPKAKFSISDTLSCIPGKTVTCTNQTTYSAADAVNYQWYVNGILQATTKDFAYNFNAPLTISNAANFAIKLVTINSYGCRDSATKLFVIYPKAQPAFAINAVVGCVPFNLQLNNTTQYANIYSWYVNGQLFSNNATPSPITLTIPATNYDIKLVANHTLGCGADSISKQFTTYTKPIADFNIPNKNSCTGILNIQCFDLSSVVGANITKWNWTFGDGATGIVKNPTHTYTTAGHFNVGLVAADNRGCKSDITYQKVANFGKPKANFTFGNVCVKNPLIPISLSTPGLGSTAITNYLWNFGDGNYLTGAQPIYVYQNEGIYTITLIVTSDSSCVADTLQKTVTVYGKPTADFKFENNCVKANTLFTNSSLSGFGQSLIGNSKWTFGDGGTSNSFNAAHIFSTTGNYVVQLAVSGNRCPNLFDSIKKVVTVYKPRDPVIYPRIQGVRGTPVQLYALSGGVQYNWTPITGLNNPSIQNPFGNYTISHPNIISYNISITDSLGCKVNDKQEVWLFTDADVFVPTAFTPNGDGANDLLKPLYVNIARIQHFRIFDRWGKVVFETSDMGKAWDGTLNGNLMPLETYTWTISAITQQGKEISKKGNVTLIRN